MKKKYTKLILLILFSFLFVAGNLFIINDSTSILFSQDNNKAYVTSIRGEVEVGKIILPKSNSDTDDLQIGEGWFVRTGKNSSAKLFVNELIVKINENTRVEITKSTNDTIRLNLKYGFIYVDSRELSDEKDVIVDTEGRVIKAEETSTVFELDFNNTSNNLDYDVKEGAISITTDEVKIYINNEGITGQEFVVEKPIEKPEDIIIIQETIIKDDDIEETDKEPEIEDDDIEEIDKEPKIEDDDIEEIDKEPEIEETDIIEEFEQENETIEENDLQNEEFEQELKIEDDDIEETDIIEEPESEIEETDIIEEPESEIEEIEKEPEAIPDILDDEILEEIEDRGMVINEGISPPDLEGKYYVRDWYLVYDNKVPPYYFDPGYKMKDYIYTFYDQTEDHKIKVKFSAVDNPLIFGEGNGAFISGENNKFTVYFRTQSLINGERLETVQIISGKLFDTSIEDFQLALIILGKIGGNVDNMEMQDFSRIGTKRIFLAKSKAISIN